jgi:hypothetical protein
MRMAANARWVSGVVLASGLAAAAWAQEQGAAGPDVSGHWRLNEALSSATPGEVATTPSPAKKDVPKDVQKGAATPAPETEKKPTELTITQSAVEIVVTETPGGQRSYYPNGKTYKADEGQSNVKSTWRDGKLVFEKRNAQGWRLTETWQIAPDRSRLTIEQVFEGGHRPKVEVKRVYDRIEAK